jgi:hypothetical protein
MPNTPISAGRETMRKRAACDRMSPAARGRGTPCSAPVALRKPARQPDAYQGASRPNVPVAPWPDLEQRARAIFGDRVMIPGASFELLKDRGER